MSGSTNGTNRERKPRVQGTLGIPHLYAIPTARWKPLTNVGGPQLTRLARRGYDTTCVRAAAAFMFRTHVHMPQRKNKRGDNAFRMAGRRQKGSKCGALGLRTRTNLRTKQARGGKQRNRKVSRMRFSKETAWSR